MIVTGSTSYREKLMPLQVRVQDYLCSLVKSCEKACLGVGSDVGRKENTCKNMGLVVCRAGRLLADGMKRKGEVRGTTQNAKQECNAEEFSKVTKDNNPSKQQ